MTAVTGDTMPTEVTNVRTGFTRDGIAYIHCTVCGTAVEIDPRGDVLDASGRCDECRP